MPRNFNKDVNFKYKIFGGGNDFKMGYENHKENQNSSTGNIKCV